MPPTTPSSATASPAASSLPELPPAGGLCAIHQPNLFPRLTTLANLFAADYWIVLDDVQFTRRDYQHRTRLAALDDPQRRRWLTIPTHLPRGRQTAIRDAVIADPARSQRRLTQMLRHYYRASPYWKTFGQILVPIVDLITATERTAQVAEAFTRMLLGLLGWGGQVLHSSDLPARPGRSQRLADLAGITGARGYLCGTGRPDLPRGRAVHHPRHRGDPVPPARHRAVAGRTRDHRTALPDQYRPRSPGPPGADRRPHGA